MAADPTIPTCPVHHGQTVRRRCDHCGQPVCDVCLTGRVGLDARSDGAAGRGTTLPAGDAVDADDLDDPSVLDGPHGSGVRPTGACPTCGATLRVERAAVESRGLPASAQRPPASPDVARGGTPVTYALLAIYVAVFIIERLLERTMPLTLLGAQINELVIDGQWWRVLTATMLHAGITHLAFNGYALYVLGPQLERGVGSAAFAALYVASGIAGGVAFLVGMPSGVAVGASGAIFGLFGAYLAAAWVNRDSTAGRAGLSQLGTLLLINLALPLFVPGIAWQAHLGGLVTGFAIGMWWAMSRRRHGRAFRSWHMVAVPVGVSVALLLGLLWYT
ncbi:MAG TPA: rhomboid family intramembrane serine protease [Euzebyales bacterium]